MVAQEEWYLEHKLSPFHGKRIAVILSVESESKVLRGTGTYELDGSLGHILRIEMEEDQEGLQDLIIVEEQWNGSIRPGSGQNCDVCLIPDAEWIHN